MSAHGSLGARICIASGSGGYGVAEHRVLYGGRRRAFHRVRTPWFAPTMAEAIDQAKRLVVNHAIELWSGAAW